MLCHFGVVVSALLGSAIKAFVHPIKNSFTWADNLNTFGSSFVFVIIVGEHHLQNC